MMHNFSMNSMGTMNNWLTLIESEVQDIAVSKHSYHLKATKKLQKIIVDYVEKQYELLSALHQLSVNEFNDEDDQEDDVDTDVKSRQKTSKSRSGSVLMRLNGTKKMNKKLPVSFATFPPVINDVTIQYRKIRHIFGKNAHRCFENLLDGDTSLDLKGVKYWKEGMEGLSLFLTKVNEDCNASSEQMRNYYSFVLTIFTITMSPMAILTGYW